MNILDKTYREDNLTDIEENIFDRIDFYTNLRYVEVDSHGFIKGSFRVIVEYVPEEENE